MRGEIGPARKKMPVRPDFERTTGRGGGPGQRLAHPPVTRLDHDQPLWPSLRERAAQFLREATPPAAGGEFLIMDGSPALCQRLAAVPHGREKHRDPRFGRPYMRGLLRHLGHPHRVLAGIKTVERGGIRIKLVAEHQHEMTEHYGHHPATGETGEWIPKPPAQPRVPRHGPPADADNRAPESLLLRPAHPSAPPTAGE